MKKFVKAFSFLLLFAFILSMLPAKVSAAGYQSIFTDTINEAWYYEEILFLTRRGVVNGYPDGSFRPDADITFAEFTKLIVLAFDYQTTDMIAFMPKTPYENHWADEYIDIALTMGILDFADIENGTYLPDSPIKRIDSIRMVIRALDIELIQLPENPFSDTEDIYAHTAYHEYLLEGYAGEGDKRLCRGEETTSRAEACSFVVRAISYQNNPTLYRTNKILKNTDEQALNTEFELIDLFTAINKNMIKRITFRSDLPINTIAGYYRRANAMFPQYFYGGYVNFFYSSYYDYYIIELEYTQTDDMIFEFKNAADFIAYEIIDRIIAPDMTDRDKIRAIHDYIILNCSYDYENYIASTIPDESYLAYGALVKNVAVCQGYSAAFNLLCRMVGIKSLTLAGRTPGFDFDNHAWNMVLLDGEIYFLDLTSDDPVPDTEGRVNDTHYMLTEDEFRALGFDWNPMDVKEVYFGLLRRE